MATLKRHRILSATDGPPVAEAELATAIRLPYARARVPLSQVLNGFSRIGRSAHDVGTHGEHLKHDDLVKSFFDVFRFLVNLQTSERSLIVTLHVIKQSNFGRIKE